MSKGLVSDRRGVHTFWTALAILSASWALFLASVASAAALPSACWASLVFSLASIMVRLMAGILLRASSAAVLLSFTRLSKSETGSRNAFELNSQQAKRETLRELSQTLFYEQWKSGEKNENNMDWNLMRTKLTALYGRFMGMNTFFCKANSHLKHLFSCRTEDAITSTSTNIERYSLFCLLCVRYWVESFMNFCNCIIGIH